MGCLHVDAHGSEDNGKLTFLLWRIALQEKFFSSDDIKQAPATKEGKDAKDENLTQADVTGYNALKASRPHYHVAVLLAMLYQASLPANLGCNVVVGQARSREQRDLLPSSNGVHCVDGRYACLYHLFRVRSLRRVDGCPIDVQKCFG